MPDAVFICASIHHTVTARHAIFSRLIFAIFEALIPPPCYASLPRRLFAYDAAVYDYTLPFSLITPISRRWLMFRALRHQIIYAVIISGYADY